MSDPILRFSDLDYSAIIRHLLPLGGKVEEAAFGFVRQDGSDPLTFDCFHWQPVPKEGFESRSGFYLELTDQMRAAIIKRAHDLQASIVEFHSHVYSREAEFSGSDILGFREFVPHVMWRLKGRPYFAVVVTQSGFDALSWLKDPHVASPLGCLRIGEKELRPTNRTMQHLDEYDEFTLRP